MLESSPTSCGIAEGASKHKHERQHNDKQEQGDLKVFEEVLFMSQLSS